MKGRWIILAAGVGLVAGLAIGGFGDGGAAARNYRAKKAAGRVTGPLREPTATVETYKIGLPEHSTGETGELVTGTRWLYFTIQDLQEYKDQLSFARDDANALLDDTRGGACCRPNNNCVTRTEYDCTVTQGWVYKGTGTVCTPNPCP